MICPWCNGRGEVIYYVETSRDEKSVTVEQRKGICRACNGSGEKPQTNADRIRAMSDEELSEYLAEIGSEANNGVIYSYRPEEWMEWLKQPADMRGEEDG